MSDRYAISTVMAKIPSTARSSRLPRRPPSSTTAKLGRPKWSGLLRSELAALDIFTDLPNDQLLLSLRGSTKGTRTLQKERKKLGAGNRRWRPIDASHMHRRISHLQSQHKRGYGPRLFSLFLHHEHQHHEATEPASPSLHRPESQPSDHHRFDCITFSVLQQKSLDEPKYRIRLSKVGNHPRAKSSSQNSAVAKYTVELSDVDQTLEQILPLQNLDQSTSRAARWSIVFEGVDLGRHRLLDVVHNLDFPRGVVNRLAMRRCRITSLPYTFEPFSHLTYLNLQGNKLTTIPVPYLPQHLQHLDLRHNMIASLSEDLLNLRSLQALQLSNNCIRVLPAWLSDWHSLQRLYMNNNPLNAPSYASYHWAFEHCAIGTKYESCVQCLSLATQIFKKRLSQTSSTVVSSFLRPPNCTCNRSNAMTTWQPPATLAARNLETNAIRTDVSNSRGNVLNVKAFLSQLSLVTDSARTSGSDLTLGSISSAGSREKRPRLDLQALIAVHCCHHETDNGRPPCIHLQTADWINSGSMGKPPVSMLKKLDAKGNTCLHIAADFGASPLTLVSLIRYGCNSTVINHDGETFLHQLTADGWDPRNLFVYSMIQRLHADMFNFEQRDYYGNTIFHKSDQLSRAFEYVPHMSEFVKKCCFKRNADGRMLNIRMGYDLISPSAWFQCSSNRSDVSGPILNLVFENSTSGLDYIEFYARPGVNLSDVSSLVEQSDPLHALARLMSRGHYLLISPNHIDPVSYADALRVILEAGTDVNQYDENGVTVLMAFMRALGRRQRELGEHQLKTCIDLLLENGADVRWISRNGDTALHHAVYHGMPHAIEPLVKAGANVNARNGQGLSVMELLTEVTRKMKSNLRYYNLFLQCMSVLADYGAEMEPTLGQELLWNEDTFENVSHTEPYSFNDPTSKKNSCPFTYGSEMAENG